MPPCLNHAEGYRKCLTAGCFAALMWGAYA